MMRMIALLLLVPSLAYGAVSYDASGTTGPTGATGATGPTGDIGPTGPAGTTDHSALLNLAADDHSQYPLGVGRAGGQTIYGGTAVSDMLTLAGTAGTTGRIRLESETWVQPKATDATYALKLAPNGSGNGGQLTLYASSNMAGQQNRLVIGSTSTGVYVSSGTLNSGVIPTLSLGASSFTMDIANDGDIRAVKTRLTPEGGFAVKMAAAGTISRGMVVASHSSGVEYCVAAPVNSKRAFGIAYTDATNNATIWVVTSGMAEVLLDASSAASPAYWIGTAGTTAGLAAAENVEVGGANHDQEVGHSVDTAAKSSLCKCVIHFR